MTPSGLPMSLSAAVSCGLGRRERGQIAKEAAEAIFTDREGGSLRLRGRPHSHCAHANAGRDRAGGTERAEKSAAADSFPPPPCRASGTLRAQRAL